jgi:3-phosphoglycerate kinase/phosphohistidine swiveling domain-containing protein
VRLNTWESILAQLKKVRDSEDEDDKIPLLMELLINLRLLGQDDRIPDLRVKKSDMEAIYAEIESTTRQALDSCRNPSSKLIYYAREVLKKLPVRQGAEEMIEQIRATAEAFEEERVEDDPMLGFAGDLRKEVHRRLSPRIIKSYLEPYLELVRNGNAEAMVRAGYVALPWFFDPEEESERFIDLAIELKARLTYLWDYESGDIATVKHQLEQNLDIFERCFLKAEVIGFLGRLTAENLADPFLELDLLKRLASFKHFLKESHRESRIDLYDYLLLDLSLGRLVFLLANDLTNNHFAEVMPRNFREALGVLRELLNISSIKGLAVGDVEQHQEELDDLRESSMRNYLVAKKRLGAISNELQRYLQIEIIEKMSAALNHILEEYELPTSRLLAVKTRFFNNFIRRTQIHVLSEFSEKVTAAVDRELQRQADDMRLYAHLDQPGKQVKLGPKSYIASTWEKPDQRIRAALGGKGNSIIDMAGLGLKVPPAFVLGYPFFSSCWREGLLGEDQIALIEKKLKELEEQSGRSLGDPDHPLILSVRSGAPHSMPGVMATILNVGLVPKVRAALEKRRGPHLVESIYKRFLKNCSAALALIEGSKTHIKAFPDNETIPTMEARLVERLGDEFLNNPGTQLLRCIGLVYESRGSHAARAFSRSLHASVKPETAVTVQKLVFGNLGPKSLSGVVITRNPITGDDELFGEFKAMAQGEEVVKASAGTEPISRLDPELSEKLVRGKRLLLSHYKQDLDIEFTVENGELYFLQARAARLGAFAQLVADTDLLSQSIIDLEEYRARIDRLEAAYSSAALPRADFLLRRWTPPISVGVPINGGVVSGTLVISMERLKEAEARRESVVYFANNTKPTDFDVMNLSHAIVTVYPGRTSHAAITAMSMNKPCIVGCGDIELDYDRKTVIFHGAGSLRLREGERVTADGNTGAVYRGVAPISDFFLPLASVSAAIGRCGTAAEAVIVVRDLIESELIRLKRETNLRRSGLDSIETFGGGNVLLRVDANVKIDQGRIDKQERLLQLLPTFEAILSRNGTPIVCSHLGDPGAEGDLRLSREELYENYSLQPVADLLSSLLGERFVFHTLSVASSGLLVGRKNLVPGKINMIENLRFASGEKDNDDAFARSLAELSDGWYVNDAFNVCHRRHASITSVARFVSRRVAGPLVVRELSILETIIEKTPRPFVAVFSGEELRAQFGVMSALLSRADRLVVIPPGESEAVLSEGKEREALPHIDSLIGSLRESAAESLLIVGKSAEERRKGLAHAVSCIGKAGGILWSGPARLDFLAGAGAAKGRSPREVHQKALHRAIREGVFTVICSEKEKQYAGLNLPGLHISTGPSAFLEFLERLSLPGITALDPASP